jgi:hypothetical protein
LRVSLYSRVSALGQDTDMQTTELREYSKRRGWDLVHEYSDQGISGAKESRPELNRLIADAHNSAGGLSPMTSVPQIAVPEGLCHILSLDGGGATRLIRT